MLTADIRRMLDWDSSTANKRVHLYYQLSKKPRGDSPYHSEEVIGDLKKANELFESGEAETFRSAVEMVLGIYAEPAPPKSVRMIDQRLEQLEKGQTEVHRQLVAIKSTIDNLSESSQDELASKIDELLVYLRPLANQVSTDQTHRL